MGLLLFVPAGTVQYWQAWAYLGVFFGASFLITLYLKELKVRTIIVKAITEDHGKILHIIGATEVIFPERDVAAKIAASLTSTGTAALLEMAAEVAEATKRKTPAYAAYCGLYKSARILPPPRIAIAIAAAPKAIPNMRSLINSDRNGTIRPSA